MTWLGGERGGPVQDGVQELLAGQDDVDEAEPQCFGSGHRLAAED